MNLTNKIALVTGAGSGIGKAASLSLAEAGADLVLLGRTRDELETTASAVESFGQQALITVADIADAAAMQRAFADMAERHDHLDIVFANAGINGTWAPLDELQPEEWHETMAINLGGTYLTLHHAVPMMRRRGGSIIITSSINGTRTFTSAGASAYATTKAGQLALGKMAALELAQYHIRVNVICPGAITTAIDDNTTKRNVEEAEEPAEFPEGNIPLTDGAPGSAEEVADLVLFLASDRARHITGTPIWIDGGQSLLV